MLLPVGALCDLHASVFLYLVDYSIKEVSDVMLYVAMPASVSFSDQFSRWHITSSEDYTLGFPLPPFSAFTPTSSIHPSIHVFVYCVGFY